MLNFNNLPRKYLLGGIGALVVILFVVTVIQPSNFLFRDQTDYEKRQQEAVKEAQEYADYLASIKPDPVASQKLYEEILDPKEVETEARLALNASQKVSVPQIPDNKLVIQPRGGKEEVVKYFNQFGQLAVELNSKTSPVAPNLFDQNLPESEAKRSLEAANQFVEQMYQTPVPPEAVEFHKAELAAMESFKNVISHADQYVSDQNANPWPQVYGNYVAINDRAAVVQRELNELDSQYDLKHTAFAYPTIEKTAGNPFGIKEAHALLGFGDTIITLFDIPRKIDQLVSQVLAGAFASFFDTFLNTLVEKIESNYKISNFLYYTDALVSGQYLNDYLTKYVPNSLDQNIIKSFVPQISCAGNKQNLQPIFIAKAKEYFNPKDVNPLDKDFYEMVYKAGTPQATSIGQRTIYQQYASGALGRAYDSALTELLNENGLKVPRTTTGKFIAASIGSIAGQLKSSLEAKFNLGTANTNSLVAQLVAQGLTAFQQKFIFKGVVLKEQSTCIPYPQLQPVIPGSTPPFVPPVIDEDDIRGQVQSQVPTTTATPTGPVR